MKRIKAWKIVCMALIPVVLLVIGTVVFRGFSAIEEEAIKIGVVIYRGDDAFISSMAVALEKQAKLVGEEIGKKIILNLVDAKNSQGSQNAQVDTFISGKYDAICVNMVDRTVASTIIDKAKEEDIPIVFFNREPVEKDLLIWEKTCYVGTDAREAGKMEGQMVVDAYQDAPEEVDKNGDGKLQYVILEGEESHQDSLIRTEYSLKTITDSGIEMQRLERGIGNWMRSPAYEQMLLWLNRYGNSIEVVLSNNDEMAMGVIEALKEKEMLEEGPLIVGIDGGKDAKEEIRQGHMQGTVVNDADGQARVIIRIACAYVQGRDPEKEVPELKGKYAFIPHYTVTKNDLKE